MAARIHIRHQNKVVLFLDLGLHYIGCAFTLKCTLPEATTVRRRRKFISYTLIQPFAFANRIVVDISTLADGKPAFGLCPICQQNKAVDVGVKKVKLKSIEEENAIVSWHEGRDFGRNFSLRVFRKTSMIFKEKITY